MDSPQHHRTPHAMRSPGHVAPINLGLPLHAPHPAPGNDPFLAPPAPAPAPAVYNGQQYNNLPAALAQQLAAMPPMPVHVDQRRGRGRGRGRGHANVVPLPVIPPAQGIGQGRGHGQGYAPAPAAMVC